MSQGVPSSPPQHVVGESIELLSTNDAAAIQSIKSTKLDINSNSDEVRILLTENEELAIHGDEMRPVSMRVPESPLTAGLTAAEQEATFRQYELEEMDRGPPEAELFEPDSEDEDDSPPSRRVPLKSGGSRRKNSSDGLTGDTPHGDTYLTHAEVAQERPWYAIDCSNVLRKILSIFFIRHWLPKYTKDKLSGDIVAGISIGCMAIPQAIAYASIAGVGPDVGLYTSIIGLLVYPLFGTSRHLTVGAASVSAILVTDSLSTYEGQDNYEEIVNTFAFFVGIMFLAMGLFGMGFVASFLSYPVVVGFVAGCACVIAGSQVRQAFYIESGEGGTFIKNVGLLKNIGETNGAAIIFCLLSLATLQAIKWIPRLKPEWRIAKPISKIPGALLLLLVFTLVNYAGDWIPDDGLVGVVTLKFPSDINLDFGAVSDDVSTFVVGSILVTIVLFAQHIAVAVNYGMKYEYDVFAGHELYGHSFPNLIGCLFGVYPECGVITHAPVADDGGCNTLMFNWVAAGLVLIVMIIIAFADSLLKYTPRAVLAGIVWNACLGMFPISKMKTIVFVDTRDTYVMLVTWLVTMFWGLAQGVGVGFVISVIFLVQRTSKPHCAIIGRVPKTTIYRSITSYPNAHTTPGIVCFRFDGALYFGNTGYFKRAIQVVVERHHRATKDIFYFILDAHSINDMDTSGVAAVEAVWRFLDGHKISFILTGVKYPVMKNLKRSHLRELIGIHHFHHTVHEAKMFVWQRLKLYFGETVSYRKDHIDEHGSNAIDFGEVNPSQLHESLTPAQADALMRRSQAQAQKSDVFAESKGFQLAASPVRISFARKDPQHGVAGRTVRGTNPLPPREHAPYTDEQHTDDSDE